MTILHLADKFSQTKSTESKEQFLLTTKVIHEVSEN